MNTPDTRRILDMIDYQAGAVVSRTVLNKKTGSVTLFAFDVNEGLSEHTTPHDALVQVLEGELDATIAGDEYRVKPGEILELPADKPHSFTAPHRCKMMLTMLRSS